MPEVLLDRSDRVAVLTVHDPDRRNALTEALSRELADAVAACEADPDVNALVVTGAPPAFCAGADLTALGEAREEGLRRIYAGFLAVANCSLPTVAAVGGAAVGAGLNLALACDVRLAGPRARFDARFLRLGIHPGGGMTWLLERIAGPQTVAAMVLLGQVLDADAAVRRGLAWDRVDGGHDELVASAVDLLKATAEAPRELVRVTKATIRATSALPAHAPAVEAELGPQAASTASPEFAARLAEAKAGLGKRT
ncbi:enoyl-CoA hydratase [Actinosynnema mirum]|uniref:Enoyl-CoA hydratase/isomerase n=1 Tax=Actinosynnema mirum (strain ATCC 29888 / DSM 43827 / JCM 3225 / NBRC 14064 / NCIMB 13271 / NRRL B-12336 / IMRU 3971 / 101) TaxID=446462 RepID=C6WN96_ACTMD|nr:enoyl-CoA hydratase [Actinosynnema mirum]ACU40460.1 Enoyl-CoA hydratase/isomerase [Actinosynnema mirum DSM 43827]